MNNATNGSTLLFSSSDHECGGFTVTGLHNEADAQANGTKTWTYSFQCLVPFKLWPRCQTPCHPGQKVRRGGRFARPQVGWEASCLAGCGWSGSQASSGRWQSGNSGANSSTPATLNSTCVWAIWRATSAWPARRSTSAVKGPISSSPRGGAVQQAPASASSLARRASGGCPNRVVNHHFLPVNGIGSAKRIVNRMPLVAFFRRRILEKAQP